MRSVCCFLCFFCLIVANIAVAGEVRAIGCVKRVAGTACLIVGENKYDVSDADPAMDPDRHSAVDFRGESVATPGVCGDGVRVHVTNIMWRYVQRDPCP
jgi:hypothetical protein